MTKFALYVPLQARGPSQWPGLRRLKWKGPRPAIFLRKCRSFTSSSRTSCQNRCPPEIRLIGRLAPGPTVPARRLSQPQADCRWEVPVRNSAQPCSLTLGNPPQLARPNVSELPSFSEKFFDLHAPSIAIILGGK
jgi:hypothetical protein